MSGCSRFTPPGNQRDSLDEETTDWRAVCGKTARTVRRAGSAKADPDPYQEPNAWPYWIPGSREGARPGMTTSKKPGPACSAGPVLCVSRTSVLRGQQRRDAAHRDAAVGAFRSGRRDLEELLAVALAGEVFRRHPELVRQHHRDRFGAAVGQRQIVDIVA